MSDERERMAEIAAAYLFNHQFVSFEGATVIVPPPDPVREKYEADERRRHATAMIDALIAAGFGDVAALRARIRLIEDALRPKEPSDGN